LESVGEFKQGVRSIKKSINEMHESLQTVDKDYFEKADKAITNKENL